MLPVTVLSMMRRQDGVISRDQALRYGVGRRQIDGLIAGGERRIAQLGVYRSAVVDASPANVIRAAALSLAPEVVIAGHAAAFWWGLTGEPPVDLAVVVPRDRRVAGCRGVTVLRGDLPAEDVSRHRDLPVLGLPLACIRGAVALESATVGRGTQMLDRALQRRVSADKILGAIERNAGAMGNRAARRL